MENPIKKDDDCGYHYFRKPPYARKDIRRYFLILLSSRRLVAHLESQQLSATAGITRSSQQFDVIGAY